MSIYKNRERIFPEYETFIDSGIYVSLKTLVRIKNEKDEKWYTAKVISGFFISSESDVIGFNFGVQKFIESCYLNLNLGVVNENILDSFGEKIYNIDENQDDEIERIKGIVFEHINKYEEH